MAAPGKLMGCHQASATRACSFNQLDLTVAARGSTRSTFRFGPLPRGRALFVAAKCGQRIQRSGFPLAALVSYDRRNDNDKGQLECNDWRRDRDVWMRSRCALAPAYASAEEEDKRRKRLVSANAVALDDISDLAHLTEGQFYDEGPGPVVVIDNYDSFTYNLCQYLGNLGCKFVVFRNDEINIGDLQEMKPSGILISPGPGTPDDSGISLQIVSEMGPTTPLFGVCMGLQCMGQAYGGKIVRAPNGVMHGKTSDVFHTQSEEETGLLAKMANPFTAARYHSLVIDKETFPIKELEITAWTSDGLIMGVRHKKYRHVEGVQFHPESIITSNGMTIVANFLSTVENFAKQDAATTPAI